MKGRPLDLTPIEFKLLALLAERRGIVHSRDKLLNEVWGYESAIESRTVDTHVRRLSQRLGLTKHDDPVKIERDLMKLVPREHWGVFPHLLIWHGRRICDARRPLCEECVIHDLCPSSRVD